MKLPKKSARKGNLPSASIPPNATYRAEYVLCGRCPEQHGPYWYAYWKEGKRLRKAYVGKVLPPEVRLRRRRRAKDTRSGRGDAWSRAIAERETRPVDTATIARARRGEWEVLLTPMRPVPGAWLGDLARKDVLTLDSGGGHQVPIFAAVGASVTSFDSSTARLRRDRLVAEREGLLIRTIEGNVNDLSVFPDASFDVIFHPWSSSFVEDIAAVWREAFRVLRPEGVLLAGFSNHAIADAKLGGRSARALRNATSDTDGTSVTEERHRRDTEKPIVFGRALEEHIGGQAAAGFAITAFFADGDPSVPRARGMTRFGATRAQKLDTGA